MSIKKPAKGLELVRKIGEREEIVSIELSDDQVDEATAELLELMKEKEALEERIKETTGNLKAQIKTVQLQQRVLRQVIPDRRRKLALNVEEWLTKSNEVIRIRSDTREVIGSPRTARAEELQEKLFPADEQQNAAPSGSSTDEASFGDVEDAFGSTAS